ncbi:unnamed protein product [Didymodactylos carnosus]|uniref:Uncharacterized protein n=1 Tax=Didymodactylos carnosus TaxID=1234261 RepID=A0A814JHE6_9BILA|nr:unnamed protein product [Didymodactylos carnosus]CAF1037646.1 unnamed protein product [Didymodactylos carnosus]CAF3699318.1 unnamed protein product [Didymodactylos carnosus]CAF3808145.1 unnamed protein product [Didymodactylos carnosus]
MALLSSTLTVKLCQHVSKETKVLCSQDEYVKCPCGCELGLCFDHITLHHEQMKKEMSLLIDTANEQKIILNQWYDKKRQELDQQRDNLENRINEQIPKLTIKSPQNSVNLTTLNTVKDELNDMNEIIKGINPGGVISFNNYQLNFPELSLIPVENKKPIQLEANSCIMAASSTSLLVYNRSDDKKISKLIFFNENGDVNYDIQWVESEFGVIIDICSLQKTDIFFLLTNKVMFKLGTAQIRPTIDTGVKQHSEKATFTLMCNYKDYIFIVHGLCEAIEKYSFDDNQLKSSGKWLKKDIFDPTYQQIKCIRATDTCLGMIVIENGHWKLDLFHPVYMYRLRCGLKINFNVENIVLSLLSTENEWLVSSDLSNMIYLYDKTHQAESRRMKKQTPTHMCALASKKVIFIRFSNPNIIIMYNRINNTVETKAPILLK